MRSRRFGWIFPGRKGFWSRFVCLARKRRSLIWAVTRLSWAHETWLQRLLPLLLTTSVYKYKKRTVGYSPSLSGHPLDDRMNICDSCDPAFFNPLLFQPIGTNVGAAREQSLKS